MKTDRITKKLTINEIKEILKKDNCDGQLLIQLQQDSRVGVKKALEEYMRTKKYLLEEKKRLHKLFYYERELINRGFCVAGIDEAGRGPLAGPVFAAAVILPPNCEILGIKDSKKLSKIKREKLFEEIKKKALAFGVGSAPAGLIDRYNILEATKIACAMAVNRLKIRPNYLLLDALNISFLPIPQKSLVKGENLSASIAAASIIAKVTRDRYMEAVSKKYPQYNFSVHKGYPTKEHFELIKRFGTCPEHRISFKNCQ